MKITVDAAAKINLLLDITGRLENGYHNLLMVMQSVSLFDTVTLEKTDSRSIEITCSEPGLPCDKKNIAYKAAVSFFNETQIKNEGLKIHIEKRIPFAAGLAGGSADAAAVIIGLDRLYSSKMCMTALNAIGIPVGSDVPFCLSGGTKLVENTGEKITPLPDIDGCFILLAKPEAGVSTAEAYADFDRLENVIHPDNEQMLRAVRNSDYNGICRFSQNVFEQVINLPEISKIKKIMLENGADLSRMSGSGPTVFGFFKNKADAEKAKLSISDAGLSKQIFICNPVSHGTIIDEIS